MGRQDISIADIARAAGVSHTTVSRALRESPLISETTRQRIRLLAQEMGYTPNALAQSLQTRHSSTLGLVVTSIADPFFIDVVKGIEEVAREAGFSVFLGASHNDPDQEMSIIETFHRRRVDGIIVATSYITSAYSSRLHRLRIPTVLINSQAESQAPLLHWVSVDDYQGARLATQHLLQLGHCSVGYIGVQNRPRSSRQRLLGYQQELIEHNIAFRQDHILITGGKEASLEEDAAEGQAALPRLLASGVTAIFCYNDMVAVGVLLACHALGISVPEQLSVIGFDDIGMASYVTPPLTTIHQPKMQLGRLATQVLLDLLQDRPGQNHILLPTLSIRASTAALTRNPYSSEMGV